MADVNTQLVTVLRGKVSAPRTEVEIAEYMSRFSLECVGRAALGYSFGPLEKHGTDYSRALKEFGWVTLFSLTNGYVMVILSAQSDHRPATHMAAAASLAQTCIPAELA